MSAVAEAENPLKKREEEAKKRGDEARRKLALNEELLALRAENATLRAEIAALKSQHLSHQNRTVEVKFFITRTDEGSTTTATIKCFD